MLSIKQRYQLILFLGITIPLSTLGQYFPSTQYTTTEGMPTPGVYDIAQTSNGMMWFMTKAGPTYYNTKEWITFPDSLDLPSSFNSKIVASENTIWVAGLNDTTFTIQYHERGRWNEIECPTQSHNLYHHIPFNVFRDNDEFLIIIGTRDGLKTTSSKNDNWKSIPLEKKRVNDIIITNQKCLITTSDGVFVLENDSLKLYSLPYDQFPDRDIQTLVKVNEKVHLLGSNWYSEVIKDSVAFLLDDVGLNQYSKGYQSSLVVKDDLILYGINTPVRIIDRDNNTWRDLPIGGEKAHIGSTRIFQDRESNIWVGDSRALFKFNTLRFVNYNKNSGLADNEVSVIKQLSNDIQLIANPRKLNIIRKNEITNFSLESDDDLSFRVLDIEEDPKTDRVYLAANDGGLYIYENDRFSKPIQVINSNGLRITSVERYKDRILVAGNFGVYELQKGKLEIIDSIRTIRNIVDLGEKVAWLSNSTGLWMYDGAKTISYTSENFDLSSVFDMCIYMGDTLVATRDGLGIIKNHSIQHRDPYGRKYPTYSLLVDNKNRLWYGTDRGIYIEENGKEYYYGIEEGLSGHEVNRNALTQDKNGDIWIGTNNGLSVFKTESINQSNINLKTEITEVLSIHGSEIDQTSDIELPYTDNGIVIRFQCLSYINEDKINFRYKIDQSLNEWVEISSSENDIIFTNLGYGDYQFEVQARFDIGEWGPITHLEFSVLKPFYLKWWFVVLSLILVFIAARTIFYFRYLFLINQKQKLKILVHERMREISDLNEQLEEKVKQRTSELQEKNIRLQEYAYINAHFLRGPLSKIMSILHLHRLDSTNKFNEKYIEILQEAVDELDEVIHSITDSLDDESIN